VPSPATNDGRIGDRDFAATFSEALGRENLDRPFPEALCEKSSENLLL
jgi:hypothetical protein